MILRRYGTFTGGIDLPDEKHAALRRAIGACGGLSRLRVPLAACGSRPARPVVDAGRSVRAGERIAVADDGGGVDVFAPLSGRVAGLATCAVAGRDGFLESPAVEIDELSAPGAIAPAERQFDWSAAEGDELLERIAAGGLCVYRRPPEPLARWLARARGTACRTLIANVIEHEPYVAADHRLLAERGGAVIEGLAILGRAIGARDVLLAADRRRTGFYEASAGLAGRVGVAQVALPHKYPIGADAILTKVLTRREAPPGASPMAVAAAVVNAATCFAVFRWVVCGDRPVGRVVTVTGAEADAPRNAWVPFGADCAEVLGATEGVRLHGGPMAGLRLAGGAVVTPATDAVLAVAPVDVPLPSPCIRCGWCSDHCPVRLNVSAMNDAFELSLLDRARRDGVLACVECGVCSYVCPARLPLTDRVRQLKRKIETAGAPREDRH